MNKSQQTAIRRYTQKCDMDNRLSSGEPLNGSLAWRIEPCCDGYILQGSNSEGLRWFETYICHTVFIGPRGAVKICTR